MRADEPLGVPGHSQRFQRIHSVLQDVVLRQNSPRSWTSVHCCAHGAATMDFMNRRTRAHARRYESVDRSVPAGWRIKRQRSHQDEKPTQCAAETTTVGIRQPNYSPDAYAGVAAADPTVSRPSRTITVDRLMVVVIARWSDLPFDPGAAPVTGCCLCHLCCYPTIGDKRPPLTPAIH